MKATTTKTMRSRWSRVFTLLAAAPFALFLLAQGCEAGNALVGGECATGLTLCGRECVDLQTQRDHCGSCSNICKANVACLAGICGGPTDAATDGPKDGSKDGDAKADGGDGSVGDGGDGGDGGPKQCNPPFNDHENCNDCGRACKDDEDCILRPVTQDYDCGPKCAPPLKACAGVCTDLQNDPFNCGHCGKFCVSFICQAGVCQGSNPGDLVVMGHDFSTTIGAASQARVISNAVYLPRSNPLQVLSFEGSADPFAVTSVKASLSSLAAGRTIRYTTSTADADLQAADLGLNYDVILIHDQLNRSAASLGAAAAAWTTPLNNFLKGGGVVVVLDGAGGQGSMPALLNGANLLAVAGHTPLASLAPVGVAASSDVIAAQVVSPYAAFSRSASFQVTEPQGPNVTFVIRAGAAGDGDPVVVHKTVP